MSDGSFGEPIARHAPLLVSIQEAMRLTGIGRSLLYERMRAGEIAFVHVGKRRLIPFAALREWTERLPPQPRVAARRRTGDPISRVPGAEVAMLAPPEGKRCPAAGGNPPAGRGFTMKWTVTRVTSRARPSRAGGAS